MFLRRLQPRTATRRLLADAAAVWPGALTALTIGTAAVFVASRYGGPALVFALLLGMAFNFLRDQARTQPGIEFTAARVLRLGVALLGVRIGVEQMLAIGWPPVVLILAMVPATMLFGAWIARRLGQSDQMGLLTGGAVAICGASAAMAISSLLPASAQRERDTVFTVVGVTTLSTVCMVIYPAILSLFELSDIQSGYIVGASVHDVAQVVGAGYVISDPAGDVATLTKLIRVAMLVPVTLVLAVLVSRRAPGAEGHGAARARVRLPGFLVGFVVLALATNLGLLPGPVVQTAETGSKWCLIVAIAALGMKTDLRELIDLGWKPVLLMVAQTAFMVAVVAAIVLIGGAAFLGA